MLNMIKVELEFIPGPDMHIFFEKGTRGGVSHISNRYGKINNEYLKYYDPQQDSKHIIHLDGNDLHGYVMSKFFPTSGFKWIDIKEFDLNIPAIVQQDAFSKLILNILKSYENYTMIIL